MGEAKAGCAGPATDAESFFAHRARCPSAPKLLAFGRAMTRRCSRPRPRHPAPCPARPGPSPPQRPAPPQASAHPPGLPCPRAASPLARRAGLWAETGPLDTFLCPSRGVTLGIGWVEGNWTETYDHAPSSTIHLSARTRSNNFLSDNSHQRRCPATSVSQAVGISLSSTISSRLLQSL